MKLIIGKVYFHSILRRYVTLRDFCASKESIYCYVDMHEKNFLDIEMVQKRLLREPQRELVFEPKITISSDDLILE